ncbi:unnamed protein product [Rotaria magnacalcarata]|uniref:Uncharacterized protein n=1 Tax=Rotaria magnacalcarata TaxID=392030 RepID=A0A816T862_9BILA|nr:unnamed protein product [Rotaria magnacalcarata]
MSTMSTIGNTVNDEKFAQIYTVDETVVQLLNNERTIKNVKPGVSSTALGFHAYLSGIHHIRISIDAGRATFGIRSRNIPPILDEYGSNCYNYSPSMYGWVKDCGRILDGIFYRYSDDQLIRGGPVYTITLNCDEHRLSMVDESTRIQDDIEVDICRAPLPWCLLIGLTRSISQVSLL